MKPILTRSEITDAVYIVTKYKIFKDGLVRTIEKYDVTNQFDAMTKTLRTENARLRELLQEAVDAASLKDMRDWRYGKRLAFLREARELGIEVEDDRR